MWSAAAALLDELVREVALTRRVLERLPDQPDWRPHPRSRSPGRARRASPGRPRLRPQPDRDARLRPRRLRRSPSNRTRAATRCSPPSTPPPIARGARSRRPPMPRSSSAGACPADGTSSSRPPRALVVRRFLLNHLVHHRGQLLVYLRMLEVTLPAIYGPSADEPSTMRAPLAIAGGLAFALVATMNAGGYRYGAADQAFYIPAILRHVDPQLFPRDAALIDSQARLFVLDELLARLLASLPVTLEAWFFTRLRAHACGARRRRRAPGRHLARLALVGCRVRHAGDAPPPDREDRGEHPRGLLPPAPARVRDRRARPRLRDAAASRLGDRGRPRERDRPSDDGDLVRRVDRRRADRRGPGVAARAPASAAASRCWREAR